MSEIIPALKASVSVRRSILAARNPYVEEAPELEKFDPETIDKVVIDFADSNTYEMVGDGKGNSSSYIADAKGVNRWNGYGEWTITNGALNIKYQTVAQGAIQGQSNDAGYMQHTLSPAFSFSKPRQMQMRSWHIHANSRSGPPGRAASVFTNILRHIPYWKFPPI